MKLAGRKNDGAWYRANKLIKSLSADEKTALQLKMEDMGSALDYLSAIQAFYEAAGLDGDENYPSDVAALATNYTTFGIPRQAWMGVLSYDTYTRSGSEGAYTYAADHQQIAFEFGKELRTLVKKFTFARRQAKDLTNIATRGEGNPGGVADADPST